MLRSTVCFAAFVAALLASGAHAQASGALQPAFPGLTFAQPIELTHAGDGSGLVYVAEKAGRVRAIDPVANTSSTVLDMTTLVRNSGEQGLLGMAFHPQFATNGHLYVHYTGRTNGTAGTTVVARYTRSAGNPAVFDPASGQVLLNFNQPYNNHNGGKLAFGPDGYLYLSLGDGGDGNDPGNRAQDRSLLFGKMLRLDVDQQAGGLTYGIPPTNPFAGNTSGYREEIYAYGLRNTFRFSFDRATGVLWGADVGQNRYEEINLVTNGGNFGWRVAEGAHCNIPSTGCDRTSFTDPVYEYDHTGGDCSVTGGFVYRGTRNPDLAGAYVFGDYCTGTLWALSYDGTTATRRTIATVGFGLFSFGEDAAGELYVMSADGRIQRFAATATGAEGAPAARAPSLRLATANPFHNRAVVEVTPAVSGRVQVTLTDLLGRELAVLLAADVAAGERRPVVIDGSDLAPGLYLVRLATADGGRATLRLARARR